MPFTDKSLFLLKSCCLFASVSPSKNIGLITAQSKGGFRYCPCYEGSKEREAALRKLQSEENPQTPEESSKQSSDHSEASAVSQNRFRKGPTYAPYKVLGSGRFGKAYLGKDKKSWRKVALKQ